MVIYCTPCILHGHFTAVPSMAALLQRMPATTMTNVVLKATRQEIHHNLQHNNI
jgi:NADPH-dependent ferric siderophore reductase